MRHSNVLFVDEPPQQTQPHHRKKKRKHKTSLNNNNNNGIIEPFTISIPQLQQTASSNSVSSENGPTCYSNEYYDCDYKLNDQMHYAAAGAGAAVSCNEITKPEQSEATLGGEGFSFGELRQRSANVAGGGGFEDSAVSTVGDSYEKEGSSVEVENQRKESSGNNGVARSETVESLGLKRVMAEDSYLEKSPVTYFLEQVYNGNSLRSTTTLGNEKGRERVYDTVFRLPWRCELVLAYRCRLLCLPQFISVIINCHANKDRDDHLEASENKEV